MDFIKDDSLPVRHTFELLSNIPRLVHGVFTRHGGVSRPPYETLNTASDNGDSPEAVQENLSRIRTSLGLGCLVSARQIHEDNIQEVNKTTLPESHNQGPLKMPHPGDALLTQLPGVGLMVRIADCQAILLVDPTQGVIANVHNGWRGSVKNLPAKTVRHLHERFGCRPQDIYAAVSPSLGPCCAEFKNYRHELPSTFCSFQSRPLYFDFWAITRWQLMDAGLKADRIDIAGRCTKCESQDFYSYRREGTTGRMAAVIGWSETL